MGNLPVSIISQTTSTITIGWAPPVGQEGYIPTIDGSEFLTDGKRHAGTSQTQKSVKIGKKTDGQQHLYGVIILGGINSGGVKA